MILIYSQDQKTRENIKLQLAPLHELILTDNEDALLDVIKNKTPDAIVTDDIDIVGKAGNVKTVGICSRKNEDEFKKVGIKYVLTPVGLNQLASLLS